MKTFKFALMCAAALAMVACGEKNPVDDPNTEDPDEKEYVQIVKVDDNSLADWDNVPAAYLATTTHVEGASMDGLKSVKVYADQMYIFLLVEVNDDVVTDRSWTPFHVYLNTDNSAATGGFADQWVTGDVDVMLETVIFADGGNYNYNPAVFKWWGEVGAAGWEWTDPENPGTEENGWGAIVPEGTAPIGASQLVDGKVEIQLLRELIPGTWAADKFTVGFDVQQSWSSVGILPNAADAEDGSEVLAEKLEVTIDWGK